MSGAVFDQARVYRNDTLLAHKSSIETAIAALRQRFDEPLSLDDLAHVAFMSRYHFTRVFTKITGVSPGRFLTAFRMQEAKRLLLHTHLNVTDISLDVGYNSLGTFTRTFTASVGLPPLRFRQLARNVSDLSLASAVTFMFAHLERNAQGPAVSGVLESSQGSMPAFVGLFRTLVPQSRPFSCALVQTPSAFVLCRAPSPGWGHISAAAFPTAQKIADILTADSPTMLVASATIGETNGGHVVGPILLRLRPSGVTDPPLLVSIPLLFLERTANLS